MFQKIENQPQHDSFDDLVKNLKWRYRRVHQGETEGLHYQFNVTRNQDGRSGFIKAERLEAPGTGVNPQTEALLIEDNRIVGQETEEQGPTRWLE